MRQDIMSGNASLEDHYLDRGDQPPATEQISDLLDRIRFGTVVVLSSERIREINDLLDEWDKSDDIPLDVAVEMKELLGKSLVAHPANESALFRRLHRKEDPTYRGVAYEAYRVDVP